MLVQSEPNLGWELAKVGTAAGAKTGGEGGNIITGGSRCGTLGREDGALGISVEGVGAENAIVRTAGFSRPLDILIGDAAPLELN